MSGENLKKATFAGGCFWCMQPPFRKLEGVTDVVVGYSGGTKENPTYEEVSTGTTGYLESVQVTYDPSKISYDKLLDTFWHQIDPTDSEGQFVDKGTQYHTAIFYHDDEQRQQADASKKALDASGKFKKPVVTEIKPFKNFYPAEQYHQDYAKKNPGQYGMYRMFSGRDQFLKKTWGESKGVTVYTTPGCNNCRMTKEYLKSKKIDFDEVDITAHEDAAEMIVDKTGQFGVPVIQIGEDFQVGFDEKDIDKFLKEHMAVTS
ncbi:peptide-methionine (S)-S-oxide reductase MsrA [Dehalogenimonas etheniformans]|uniref:peptide-methionine (S)-S-oxide reductase MsrA n=1 Tax=Dehalogenimonas etheniformans TaxID=1536648 RepID=UPI0013922D2C|nr:peptide-methionine (S)-S-oxide reductase MsrA [Dehalogenimonas etheniformans]QNT76945.1 peptide-methionine (S)-S-oxide reductase MsrA [Dehalogenimonas etheniformans]